MVIDELFPKCKSISVDYVIMEKVKDMYVFPENFSWSNLDPPVRERRIFSFLYPSEHGPDGFTS